MGVNSILFGPPRARRMARTYVWRAKRNHSRKIPTRNISPLFSVKACEFSEEMPARSDKVSLLAP